MTLMNTFLQFEEFADSFRWLSGDSVANTAYLALIAVVIISVVVGGFAFIKFVKSHFEYQGEGRKLGKTRVTIHGKPMMIGMLNRNEKLLSKEDLLLIFGHERLQQFPENMKKLLLEGTVKIYDIKLEEAINAKQKMGGQRTYFCTYENLEDSKFSWFDETGYRTITSILIKQEIRNIQFYDTAQKANIKNEDGNLDVFWWLDPVPSIKGVKEQSIQSIIKRLNNPDEDATLKITVNTIAHVDDVSKFASYSSTFADSIRINNELKEDKKALENTIEDVRQQASAINKKLNRARHLLNQKIFVGFGKPLSPLQRSIMWGWIIGGVICGGFGYALPELHPWFVDMNRFAGIGIALLIVVLGVKFTSKKFDEENKQFLEESAQGVM